MFIGHQCNCVTKDAKGLAKQIFDAFPWANDYCTDRIPGTIKVYGMAKIKGLL